MNSIDHIRVAVGRAYIATVNGQWRRRREFLDDAIAHWMNEARHEGMPPIAEVGVSEEREQALLDAEAAIQHQIDLARQSPLYEPSDQALANILAGAEASMWAVSQLRQQPPARPSQKEAQERFAAWFRKEYPGKHGAGGWTEIHDPDWHAPKIFQAVLFALRSTPDAGRQHD